MSLYGAGVFVALALLSCTAPAPLGAPCTTASACASGLCLRDESDAGRCVARCAEGESCGPGRVCGRFDLRGRDEAGLPAGDPQDVVRVCRAPLNRPCAQGCASDEGCFGGGVCSRACERDGDCEGRACVGCDTRLCAPPCDAIAECPSGFVCDTRAVDGAGHGQCLAIDPRDGGTGCADAS